VRVAVEDVAKCGGPSLENSLEVFKRPDDCCSHMIPESRYTPSGRRFTHLEQIGSPQLLRLWNLLLFHQVVTWNEYHGYLHGPVVLTVNRGR
jgi:hypothetical protein